ncbi:hypothetical protein ACLKA7_007134 [Drosophila subpalustris]
MLLTKFDDDVDYDDDVGGDDDDSLHVAAHVFASWLPHHMGTLMGHLMSCNLKICAHAEAAAAALDSGQIA